ncbi:penicillin-insensitive murein endopeptidase [Ignatzschineria rhizosphaerae]|uniref:Penicillin-insensitive murein endopeptidase n=1 Tax=Ignatzschineria rhizosphaerae TaxID=2923279 RepID=A0ABY3X2E9_9GAMM|nr:penicillin-insensitive murein endopeptidase [Ignatzschineria rhizosphaerae]UNM97059.1 penicillin-insensitive murein endopeptidase [Ignatzschineria rhizosphaerae]
MGKVLGITIVLSALLGVSSAQTYSYKDFKTPTEGQSEVIGSYANGCLLGGEKMALSGPGYQLVRQSRNRHFGHPKLLTYLEKVGIEREKRGQLLLVSDMSQPRGGRMHNSAHASHQNGLDVDIWLYEFTPEAFKSSYIEGFGVPSVVDKAKGTVNANWRREYFNLFEDLASFPEVDRIFINPVIKKELCSIDENAAWQYKVRPWFGHDDHLHVRLTCPEGAKDCVTQAPIPKQSGCNADLDNWIKDQSDVAINGPKPRGNIAPVAPPPLHPRCQMLFEPAK